MPKYEVAQEVIIKTDSPEEAYEIAKENINNSFIDRNFEVNEIMDTRLLKYKNILFDEWTEDEHSIWANMCANCKKKYKDRLNLEIDNSGGFGACSVKGCNVVGADDDIEMFYIDFDINGVEFVDFVDSEHDIQVLLNT